MRALPPDDAIRPLSGSVLADAAQPTASSTAWYTPSTDPAIGTTEIGTAYSSAFDHRAIDGEGVCVAHDPAGVPKAHQARRASAGGQGAASARQRVRRPLPNVPPATIALRAQRVECVEATGEQDVEKAARLAGMSMSAFYRDFQAITTMSPIRFQKRIRLQVADSSAWTSALRGGW